jgi:hypothetical protein
MAKGEAVAELSPTDRQKLEAALVVLEEIKRSLESEMKRVDVLEKTVREMLEKTDGLIQKFAD